MTSWGNRPPATYFEEKVVGNDGKELMVARGEIPSAVQTLSIAFPNMQPDFWALLTSRFRALGYSKERLKYILHIAIDTDELINQYRFGRLSVADILSITKPLNIIPLKEAFERYDNGDRTMVVYHRGPKDDIILESDDAEFACLEVKPFRL